MRHRFEGWKKNKTCWGNKQQTEEGTFFSHKKNELEHERIITSRPRKNEYWSEQKGTNDTKRRELRMEEQRGQKGRMFGHPQLQRQKIQSKQSQINNALWSIPRNLKNKIHRTINRGNTSIIVAMCLPIISKTLKVHTLHENRCWSWDKWKVFHSKTSLISFRQLIFFPFVSITVFLKRSLKIW